MRIRIDWHQRSGRKKLAHRVFRSRCVDGARLGYSLLRLVLPLAGLSAATAMAAAASKMHASTGDHHDRHEQHAKKWKHPKTVEVMPPAGIHDFLLSSGVHRALRYSIRYAAARSMQPSCLSFAMILSATARATALRSSSGTSSAEKMSLYFR